MANNEERYLELILIDDDSSWILEPNEESNLDHEMELYFRDGRDKMIEVNLFSGGSKMFRVSQIKVWGISTKESREKGWIGFVEREKKFAEIKKSVMGFSDE